MKTPMIYIVRHGQTEWNAIGRQQGHLDSPLTEKGQAQARAAGRALREAIPEGARIRVETSPLGRAKQTAALVCQELGIDPAELVDEPMLMEHNMGYWQGLTNDEVEARFPGQLAARAADKWNFRVPGGESYAIVDARARAWLARPPAADVTIAVTHEMLSRNLQGAYGALGPAGTLACSHRQDRVYWLHDGRVEMIETEVMSAEY